MWKIKIGRTFTEYYTGELNKVLTHIRTPPLFFWCHLLLHSSRSATSDTYSTHPPPYIVCLFLPHISRPATSDIYTPPPPSLLSSSPLHTIFTYTYCIFSPSSQYAISVKSPNSDALTHFPPAIIISLSPYVRNYRQISPATHTSLCCSLSHVSSMFPILIYI